MIESNHKIEFSSFNINEYSFLVDLRFNTNYNMFLLIVFFCLSIVFSFLCSIWEAVLLSVTPSYVRRKVAEGSSLGKQLESYKEDIDRPLSAILTLNTIAHTVGAIGVGAQAGKVFGETSIAGINGESIVAALMTLAILILSEIIPKTIGANMWQQLAPFTLRSLKFLLFILTPFVWISQLITKSLKKEKDKSVLSRSDFQTMVSLGESSGTLAKSESTIIQNLIRLEESSIQDIMTPRTVMFMVDENTSTKEFFENNQPLQFSRIPVYKDNPENIIGMVLKDDILEELAEDRDDLLLAKLVRPLNKMKNTTPLPKLFDTLIAEKLHMVAVMDNYGTVVGIVTMEDLMETIIGHEIIDESDQHSDLQVLAKKKLKENNN